MTHPSIQGLREAVASVVDVCHGCSPNAEGPERDCPRHGDAYATADAALAAQVAYLTEHGVLLSGEGLVRAEPGASTEDVEKTKRFGGGWFLYPVPQDSE